MTARCQIYLFTPPLAAADLEAFAPRFAAAAKAVEAASVLLRLAPGAEADAKRIVSALLPIAAEAGAALLVEKDARLAARAGADGAHVAGAALAEALDSLKPERIVGVGGLKLRDDAMSAGEAGADYVMFGEPRPDGWRPHLADTLERVSWWAEIFQTPCVAYAGSPEEAGELAAVGADFVALGDWLWADPEPAKLAAEALRRIRAPAEERG